MIKGTMLRDAMISASHALSNVKQAVDALNVFPVPDGDTGTNMSMTMNNAARELARLQNPTATEVADVASSALLRGARGNSGVILSLLFRGFSKGMKGKDVADGADLAQALTFGMEAAYKAVMKPTEGTILTVSREAAEAGKKFAKKNNDPIAVWEAICKEAEASLKRTPDLLPQLKKAGVVDAGGKGFCVIIEAMLDVFKGGEIVAGETAAAAAFGNHCCGGDHILIKTGDDTCCCCITDSIGCADGCDSIAYRKGFRDQCRCQSCFFYLQKGNILLLIQTDNCGFSLINLSVIKDKLGS